MRFEIVQHTVLIRFSVTISTDWIRSFVYFWYRASHLHGKFSINFGIFLLLARYYLFLVQCIAFPRKIYVSFIYFRCMRNLPNNEVSTKKRLVLVLLPFFLNSSLLFSPRTALFILHSRNYTTACMIGHAGQPSFHSLLLLFVL